MNWVEASRHSGVEEEYLRAEHAENQRVNAEKLANDANSNEGRRDVISW